MTSNRVFLFTEFTGVNVDNSQPLLNTGFVYETNRAGTSAGGDQFFSTTLPVMADPAEDH